MPRSTPRATLVDRRDHASRLHRLAAVSHFAALAVGSGRPHFLPSASFASVGFHSNPPHPRPSPNPAGRPQRSTPGSRRVEPIGRPSEELAAPGAEPASGPFHAGECIASPFPRLSPGSNEILCSGSSPVAWHALCNLTIGDRGRRNAVRGNRSEVDGNFHGDEKRQLFASGGFGRARRVFGIRLPERLLRALPFRPVFDGVGRRRPVPRVRRGRVARRRRDAGELTRFGRLLGRLPRNGSRRNGPARIPG